MNELNVHFRTVATEGRTCRRCVRDAISVTIIWDSPTFPLGSCRCLRFEGDCLAARYAIAFGGAESCGHATRTPIAANKPVSEILSLIEE